MSYPHPIREVIADGVIHVIGITGATLGVVLLLHHSGQVAGGADTAAVAIYGGFLLLALCASAAYHMLPWERTRPLLHKIDHAAIYLKIAGTYTPFVVFIGSAFSYVVLAIVWLVALSGAIAKLSIWRTDGRGSLALYLALGWACVLLFPVMVTHLPAFSLGLMVAGGLLYTVGTVFFSWNGLPYQNAIWHSFVLSASTCFLCSIALATGAT